MELGIAKEEDLLNYSAPLDSYGNFQKALQFANEDYREVLNNYNNTVKNRIHLDNLESIYKNGVIERYRTYSLFGEGDKYSQIVCLRGKIRENEPERVYYVLTNKKNTTFQDFKEELLSDKITNEDYECILSYETNKADGGDEQ